MEPVDIGSVRAAKSKIRRKAQHDLLLRDALRMLSEAESSGDDTAIRSVLLGIDSIRTEYREFYPEREP